VHLTAHLSLAHSWASKGASLVRVHCEWLYCTSLCSYLHLTLRSSAFSDPSVALEFRDVSLAAGVLSSQKWMLRPSDVIGSGISSTASAVTSAAAVAAAAAAATANVVVTAMQSEAVATGISNGITVVGTGVAGASRLKPFVRWWLVNNVPVQRSQAASRPPSTLPADWH
jgi:hypothetical protein